ncbi:CBS domain-containing protein [Lutibacter oricola]|nr:CBS domain-containing protein [Lutibacter oricola]
MDITPYILKDFKPFTLHSTIEEVKEFFNTTTFNHFPIVEKDKLVGLISETEIQGLNEEEKEIGYYQYLFEFFSVEEEANILDVLKEFASNQTTIMPVLNLKNNYIGYYDVIDVLHTYNETPFFNSNGAVLLLEKELRDYSISEVSQIIESNNGKVLGVFVSETSATSVKIMVKFDSQNINEIIQSFRRYEYQVLSNHKDDSFLEDLKDRSNYLQKYLNI